MLYQLRSVKVPVLTAIFLMTAFSQAGCSSGSTGTSSSSAPTTVSGVVSAGPVNGATVTAYLLNANGSQGAKLLSTTTDSVGRYSMSLDAQPSPVVFVATGGSYVEEASNLTISIGSAQLRTVLSNTSLTQQIAITPITEIAVQHVLSSVSANSGSSLSSLIQTANAKIASGMGLTDITLPPADPTKPAASASSAQAAQYAVVLAAISKMAASATTNSASLVTSLDMMQALATSFTYNGSFNQTVPGGSPIPVPNANGSNVNLATVLTAIGGSTDFSAAISTSTLQYLASANASSLGYNTLPTLTYVTAPAVPSGGVNITLPAPPAVLPSVPPTVAGPPPAAGQAPSAVPSLIYPSQVQAANVGSPLSVSPTTLLTNGGAITNCTIKSGTPALPAPLSLDTHTCFISGTPSSAFSATTFTINATNSLGASGDALVTIFAQIPPPHIYIADGSSGNLVCTLNTSNGTINTCGPHTGGNYYAPFDFDYVLGSLSQMYVATGVNVANCPINLSTGALSCGGAAGGLSQAKKVRIHNTASGLFAYLIASNGINACPISTTNGYPGTCQVTNSGLTVPVAGQSTTTANWYPNAIDFFTAGNSSTYAYVIESHTSGGIFKCNVNNTTGLLSACAVVTPAGMPANYGIYGLTNIKIFSIGSSTYAYMALASQGVVKCSVDATTGALSSCAASNGGIGNGVWYTNSIAFSNLGGATTYAYVSDINLSAIYVCTVNSTTGDLTSCATTAASGLTQPLGLSVF